MFADIWNKKPQFLIDVTLDFMHLCTKLLQMDVNLSLTTHFNDTYDNDYRDVILPKKSFADRKIYAPVPYTQLFGDTFVPNLSIVDLIMCEGSQAREVLAASFLREKPE